MRPTPAIALVFLSALTALPARAALPAGMVAIPAGIYAPLRPAAGEARSIPVPAFYLDATAVTNGQFLEFVRAMPAWRRSRVSPLFADPGYLGDWSSDLTPGPNAPLAAPVVRVSWFAARAYAQWRGKRLPSIAEWERASLSGVTDGKDVEDPTFVWEWVEDFNSAEVAEGAVCGGGGDGVRNFDDYPAFLRSAFRSSLRASYVLANLGFRCALSSP